MGKKTCGSAGMRLDGLEKRMENFDGTLATIKTDDTNFAKLFALLSPPA